MASLISDHRYVQIHWRHCIPCIRNSEEWLGRWSCATGHVPRCVLLPHHYSGITGEKLKAYNFVISGRGKSLQVLKRNSAYHSSDVFTVIRAEVRPSQRVNKKPHKVWVAAQTDGTILLFADLTVPYGIISLCVIARWSQLHIIDQIILRNFV